MLIDVEHLIAVFSLEKYKSSLDINHIIRRYLNVTVMMCGMYK
jgi:hypothetical protein